MAKPLYILNDNTFEIDPVTDSTDESAVTTGTGSFVLKSAAGTTVASGVVSHIANGLWRGEVPASASLTENTLYYLEVTIASSGRDGFWRMECRAQYRPR